MEIYNEYIEGLCGATLILGFFDGIHSGHRKLIESSVNWARENDSKTAVLTFNQSPAVYFGKKSNKNFSVYSRDDNYEIISSLGVDYIFSVDFSELAKISAEGYLKKIVDIFSPKAIFTGYNYTFGHDKRGDTLLLRNNSEKYGYKYYCVEAVKSDIGNISSTLIKDFLKIGDLKKANEMLCSDFFIKSKVIHGQEIGRSLGFPTANMCYPENIIRPPHGVYKARVMERNAVLNWGTKPTVGGGTEVLEVHIPGFEGDLYGKELKVFVGEKIRDEKKFSGPEELKFQIEEDVKKCLE